MLLGALGLVKGPLIRRKRLIDYTLGGVGTALESGECGADSEDNRRQRHLIEPRLLRIFCHIEFSLGSGVEWVSRVPLNYSIRM